MKIIVTENQFERLKDKIKNKFEWIWNADKDIPLNKKAQGKLWWDLWLHDCTIIEKINPIFGKVIFIIKLGNPVGCYTTSDRYFYISGITVHEFCKKFNFNLPEGCNILIKQVKSKFGFKINSTNLINPESIIEKFDELT